MYIYVYTYIHIHSNYYLMFNLPKTGEIYSNLCGNFSRRKDGFVY